MIAAGIGCRRGATREDIEAVLAGATAAHGIACSDIALLATVQDKAGEPGIVEAARGLGVTVRTLTTEQLRDVADRVLTHSARVQAARGVPSLAEAAALIAAGTNARLLGPRFAGKVATCALAIGGGGEDGDPSAGPAAGSLPAPRQGEPR